MCQRCIDRHNEVYKTGIQNETKVYDSHRRSGPSILFKLLLIPIIISAIAIIVQIGFPRNPPSGNYQTKSAALTISDQSVKSYWEGQTLVIEGLVQNTTNKSYSLVLVSFNILDKDGIVLDVISDSITGLKAGGTWKFKASGYANDQLKDAKRYELFELKGY